MSNEIKKPVFLSIGGVGRSRMDEIRKMISPVAPPFCTVLTELEYEESENRNHSINDITTNENENNENG